MARDLVVVESPTKARTLSRILGPRYAVKASLGHIRDLPPDDLGVDVERGFTPRYILLREKAPVVKELKGLAREADRVYLATDPDREGEAIAWHLVQAIGLDSDKARRVEFHEITERAVREAFRHPRTIDLRLVQAQQARRVLDRLVGYKLSPLLWEKMRWPGLSAGRVQSAALRMVVEREREVEAFQPREYWTIEALLARDSASFTALLHAPLGQREKMDIPRREEAERLLADLEGASFTVAEVRAREVRVRPAPPFITSTLQQEAWRKLRFPAKKTMLLAQQLYEGIPLGDEGPVGLITYMRTDSTHIAPEAVQEARGFIREAFGPDYLPPEPRTYITRVKGAQEAHEAIRPTSVRRTPEMVKPFLTPDQSRLYELIWKRFLACQMRDALLESTTADIHAGARSGAVYLFRATGSVVKFPGFRTLYQEGRDEPEEEDGKALPPLVPGEALRCLKVEGKQHFTKPPPRYTEASLIKALEEKGIGRPSTYAAIVSTIQERGYVKKEGGYLKPLPLGRVVSDLLARWFPEVVDYDFTAQMEEGLDEVARGQRPWTDLLRRFYGPFAQDLEKALQEMPPVSVPAEGSCPQCERPLVVKRDRRGRLFLSCSGFPGCRYAEPYQLKVGVECPRCGGDLVEKRSRRGRKRSIFYGCSNWPACSFTVGRRPLPAPCPQCGGLLVEEGRRRARCTACEYRGPVPQPETASAEV